MDSCTIEECQKPHRARGLCATHYMRWRQDARRDPCAIDGCTDLASTGGVCYTHYRRQQRHGNPHYQRPMWRDDRPSWTKVHHRLRYVRGRASEQTCSHCRGPAAHWAYDNSDPDAQADPERGGLLFSADLQHYIPLCVPCHKQFDMQAAGASA